MGRRFELVGNMKREWRRDVGSDEGGERAVALADLENPPSVIGGPRYMSKPESGTGAMIGVATEQTWASLNAMLVRIGTFSIASRRIFSPIW